jgi:S-adenosyl-L-methionine hydrolase (adenosine-forming)
MSPIITLTTDFGLRDPFVGVMKGVALGICRSAQLVDLTHEVSPYDVREGAIALESAWRFFPSGSVHLAVIDPGVGSARRALAVSAAGHYFVGPDNGLFSFALDGGGWKAVSIEAPDYRLSVVSQTFHGRDIFAPAAAHLASGVAIERLGPTVTDPVRLERAGSLRQGDELIGEIIGSDRFGNLLTSITGEEASELAPWAALAVKVGERNLGAPVTCYEEAAAGVPRAIVGSSGRIEIFVRTGSALAVLGARRGTVVRIARAR